MQKTENYRRQHNNMRKIITRIEELISRVPILPHIEELGHAVRKLFGDFGTHLAIEDKVLYPKALTHDNPRLKATAQRFQTEMGNLGSTFERYRKKWPGPFAISKDPDAFILETKEILTLFKQRLDREEAELYEIYDQVA